MNKLAIRTPVYIQKVGAKLVQKSPELCLVGGIGLGVGAAVLACRATLKVNDVIETHKKNLKNIDYVMEEKEKNPGTFPDYSEEDAKKDLATSTIQMCFGIAKLYLPSVIMGGVSIALLLKGHGIMAKRLQALSTAYSALQMAYSQYRKRIAEEIGEEREKELFHDIRKLKIVDMNDDGTAEERTEISQQKPYDPYSRVFDETNPWWEKNAERNQFFLYMQQKEANRILNTRGHIFLNDVYRMLGFEDSEAGAVVGWRKDGDGDGFVDFGIWNPKSPNQFDSRFVNGLERSVWLTFNVDGLIYNKI